MLERLPGIAKQIMDLRRTAKWSSSSLSADVEQYPYFSFAVLDLYRSFLVETIADCERKCMDEFLDTRTVYWHLAEEKQGKLPIERFASASAQEAVKGLDGKNTFTKIYMSPLFFVCVYRIVKSRLCDVARTSCVQCADQVFQFFACSVANESGCWGAGTYQCSLR